MTLLEFLSVLRLCLVPPLLTLGWLQLAQAYFWTLVFALGTDVAGGCLARHWGHSSPRGAQLHSRADLVLFLSMPAGVSLLFPGLVPHSTALMIVLIGAYLLTDIVGFLRGERPTSGNTWAAIPGLGRSWAEGPSTGGTAGERFP